MAWIEVHDTLPDHWKAEELAQELDTPLPATIGHLVCLWLKAIRFKPGGKLTGVSKLTIAKWAQWPENVDVFVNALVKHGWLDNLGGRGKTLCIHDWPVYTRSFQKAIADRDRKRKARGRGLSEDVPRTGAVDQTRPDQTRPDQTRPEQPGGTDPLPPPPAPSSSSESEVIRQLMQKAKAAKIRNAPDTIRRNIEGWIARFSTFAKGAQEVERVLMLDDGTVRGHDVFEIQDAHFKDNGKPKSGVQAWADAEKSKGLM